EAAAHRRTRLSLRRTGDGTTRLSGLLPDAVATRLATYLEAFTNPRKSPDDALERLPYQRRLGQAFCQLLEAVDPSRLPLHGGDATTVIVTLSLDDLRRELGTAQLYGGAAVPGGDTPEVPLTAAEARRLACTARIIPAVLGGRSEVLDLGRGQRLFSAAQRKALLLRDRHCRAEGCDIPGTWCEAHHWIPWSSGGRTDLADGLLLCHHHHHRVHDGRYRADLLPDGSVRFSRRT
ncbi:HNH endonuclease signature motif containing protein, partial [Nocardioides sp.]|uniref:HNH endonuclease signature motif containing protein n=1 Tax=Nocardioides sp. TaxID=35761 RepID=UPI002ED98FF9